MGKSLLHRPETAVDVFKLLPEGVLCQVINNTIYMSPAPSFNHQDVVGELIFVLRQYVVKNKLGKCVPSPVDVFLDKFNAYQPDIIFISNENLEIIRDDGKVYGAPDMVIEVLSPGNAVDDKVKKRKVYEATAVKEYFIVNPDTRSVISFYHNGKRFEKGAAQKGKIVSKQLKKTFKF